RSREGRRDRRGARHLRQEPRGGRPEEGSRHPPGIRVGQEVKGASALPLAAVFALLVASPAGAARQIDYLYVDASEGGGSGGHVAIGFGDRVFHFEHRAPGLLRLAREPVVAVRHRYGVFENRTIVVSHIAVSDATYDLVLDEFTRRLVVQQQHLASH